MPEKEAPAQAGMISTDQASKLLKITPQWLRQLSAQGWIPKAAKGKYPLVAVVQGYIASLKDDLNKTTRTSAENGLKAARQREVEMRVAEREARVVEMDDVEAVVSSIYATLRNELMGVPAGVTRDVKLREEIAKGINGAFARSQDKFREASAALRSGRDPLGADREDDA